MEIFRTGNDIWGRPVLEGVSWDLLWVAVIVGALVILGHALYRALRRDPEE
jgi:hypothetical protein